MSPSPSVILPKEQKPGLDSPSVLQLLRRGDNVAVIKGRITIHPQSGLPLPPGWLEVRQERLSREIIGELEHDVYLYETYTTGSYPNKAGGRSDGVTLQFRSTLSGERRYVVFNAQIRRKNKSDRGKIGDILPNKQFSAGPDSHFTKFWLAAGLPAPQRKGRYSNSMGKLRGLLFVAEVDKGERLSKESLRPLELQFRRVQQLFGLNPINSRETIPKHSTNNPQTIRRNIALQEPKQYRGLQPNSATEAPSYGNTVIREGGNRVTLKSPQEQTNEEWLEDYINRDREIAAVESDAKNQGRGTW